MYRRLCRPQGRSGWVRKKSFPPGFDPRTFQTAASCCTDWAIQAPPLRKELRVKMRSLGASHNFVSNHIRNYNLTQPQCHNPSIHCEYPRYHSSFGGLEGAFVVWNPAEATGFFRAKKSSARLPSEGKKSRLSHVVDLQHVKDPWMLRGSRAFSGKIHRSFLAQVVPSFTTRVSGGDTWWCK